MKHALFLILMAVLGFALPTFAGDVVDLGESHTVPDWAVGPLLVVPIDRFHDATKGRVSRRETKRIGTIQSRYLELNGHRYRLASIGLSEIPNSSYSCDIKTVPEAGRYYAIRLSQGLSDQTYYYILIETMDASSNKPVEHQQFEQQLVVWDIKSHK